MKWAAGGLSLFALLTFKVVWAKLAQMESLRSQQDTPTVQVSIHHFHLEKDYFDLLFRDIIFSVSGLYYKYNGTGSLWLDGFISCQKDGSHLAMFKTQPELEALRSFVGKPSRQSRMSLVIRWGCSVPCSASV